MWESLGDDIAMYPDVQEASEILSLPLLLVIFQTVFLLLGLLIQYSGLCKKHAYPEQTQAALNVQGVNAVKGDWGCQESVYL